MAKADDIIRRALPRCVAALDAMKDVDLSGEPDVDAAAAELYALSGYDDAWNCGSWIQWRMEQLIGGTAMAIEPYPGQTDAIGDLREMRDHVLAVRASLPNVFGDAS